MKTLALSALALGVTLTTHAAMPVPNPEPVAPPPGGIVVPPPGGSEPPPSVPPRVVAPVAPSGPVQPELTVSLMDGSRLKGTTTLTEVRLRSEALGTLAVPLAKVASVKFGKDRESVTVTLQNGDRLQAALVDTTVALTTIFGPVTVPLEKATEFQVRTGGASRTVEWDLLPVPVDPNWGGDMGEAPRLDGNELVLRGWAARGVQTYRQPTVIECEVVLDSLQASDGCIWINLGTANHPRTRLLREPVFSVVLGATAPTGGGGHLTLEHPASQARRLSRGRLRVTERTPYRLRVEFAPDALRVHLNDQTFETEPVVLPDEDVQLYIRGWQPANTWRVRNVTVR